MSLSCRRIVIVFFVGLIAAGSTVAGMPSSPTVLVLHSSYRGYSWTDQQELGIIDTLARLTPQPQVTNEYLDLYRHTDPGYRAALVQFFRAKYPHHHFDIIICTDDPALQFMLDYRETLFPYTPVIFCGINNFNDALIAGHTRYTGVSETIDVRSTLEAAFMQLPETRNVVVIGDHAKYYYDNRDMLRAVMPAFAHRARFIFLEGVPLARLETRLRTFPPRTILLLLSHLRNEQGELLPPMFAMQHLSTASPFPIYTCWDFFLGNGVLGGRVISGYSQGIAAAEKAIRILQGTPIAAIPVQKVSPSAFAFDYRALQRFHISTASLPAGSRLLHLPDDWYTIHKGIVWGSILLLIGLASAVLFERANIHRRIRAEEQLSHINERLNTLIDASPVAIIAINPREHVTEWNPAAEIMFGWTKQEVFGRSLPTIPPGEEPYRPYIDANVVQKKFMNCEVRRCCKDGSVLDVLLSTAPLFDRGGQYCGYMGLLVDITERKRMEEQARLLQIMQEKERMQAELLSCVSHELKTPLTPIMAGLELLDDGDYTWTEKRQHIIRIMRRQAKRLLLLINDLLNLASAESEQLTLQCEAVDLAQLAQQCLASFQPALAEHRLSGQLRCETDATMVSGDPYRLAQVMDNLVSNAFKYTEHGGITVRIYSHEEMICVEVADTGIGLDAEELERIFQRFYQVDSNQPGAGLGLAITRQLIAAHGGSVWAQSPGLAQGSTFAFCLPTVMNIHSGDPGGS